ncbi:ribonuclease E/G [Candidatus Dependentiae bacterium]|nr:ribonuclease E/G [Candidatus Dependentiae bacterium]
MTDLKIVIASLPHQILAGMMEKNEFVEFAVEQIGYKSIAGNIYIGEVKKIIPALQAVFVDIGIEKLGFLHINEIIDIHSINPELRIKHKIENLLKPGDKVTVQVLKDGYYEKGPQLTLKLTIPGKLLIALPEREHIGFSNKIADDSEKKRISNIINVHKKEKNGYIARTECLQCADEEIIQEIKRLNRISETIQSLIKNGRKFAEIYSNNDIFSMIRREFIGNKQAVIYYDDMEIKDKLEQMICLSDSIKLCYMEFSGTAGIFNIYSEYQKLTRNKVWLKCGGHFIIEFTEAFTSIDINTGKNISEKNKEKMILLTNIEAVQEIAKQIRLRNISGIILIDLMNMMTEEEITEVLTELENELSRDRVRSKIFYTPQTGIIQILRRRNKNSISQILFEKCHFCSGYGKIFKLDSQIINIERKIKELALLKNKRKIFITVSPELFNLIESNNIINKIEKKYNVKIILNKNETYYKIQYNIDNTDNTGNILQGDK